MITRCRCSPPHYLTPAQGFLLLGVIAFFVIRASVRQRSQRAKYGFELESSSTAILKIFVALQALRAHYFGHEINLEASRLSVVVLGIVAFSVYIITMHTRFGRYLYAVGGNKEAAILSGVPVKKVIIGAYVMLGRHCGAYRIYANGLLGRIDHHHWQFDGARCHCGLRYRWY